MPYFPKNHVLFIHIPKTGGTSIEHGFRNIGDEKLLYTSHPSNNVIPEKIFRKTSLQHQFYSTIKKYQNECGVIFDDKLRVFSVVRNPYDKVISDLFFYKLISSHSTGDEVENVIRKYLSLTPEQCDNHNVPQYVFLVDETGNLSDDIQIFHTETLNQELKDNHYPVSENKALESKCSKPYYEFLNNKSINLINRAYRRDFELFKYVRGNTVEEIKNSDKEKERLNKYNILPGQRCKSPGCNYQANVSEQFLVTKPKEFHGYCCQDCKNCKRKLHGVYCQKIPYF